MGKGETMPKRNRNKRKKLHYTEADKLLVKLEQISKTGSEDASAANSLKLWYLEHKSWTTKQWVYVKALCAKSRDRKKRAAASKKFQLYAISDGSAVKLGYSYDIKKRIKAMQTGHPQELACVWKYYVGRIESEAKQLEKKLHRYCRKRKIRGEWFDLECMVLVKRFGVMDNITREFEMEKQELEILAAAQDRI